VPIHEVPPEFSVGTGHAGPPGLSRGTAPSCGSALARIAVIDDEEAVQRILRLVLERAGHEVVLADDGLRGIAVVRRQRPTLVVLDIMMPFMDGATVLEELRRDEKTRGIPILVLTAATVSALRSRLLESGAARVITKPFDPSEVVIAVNELLASSDARIPAPPA
jgi:DNA-binding response OmpR family regulator